MSIKGEAMSGYGLNVQYGAGWSAAKGWLNFDSSPSVQIERMPIVGRFLKVNADRFPEDILYGDIIKGLPVAPSSAKAVYASHVLEHLAFEDCQTALANTHSILRPGGVFRLIVPDLQARAEAYMAAAREGAAEGANDFCRSTLFGHVSRPRGLVNTVRSALGNQHHLWMWDERSMRQALQTAGFVNIRRCRIGDAADPDFATVESADRFHDMSWDIVELAIEARRAEAS